MIYGQSSGLRANSPSPLTQLGAAKVGVTNTHSSLGFRKSLLENLQLIIAMSVIMMTDGFPGWWFGWLLHRIAFG